MTAQGKWTKEKAKDWYKQQPWLVGGNYIPSTSINQLEMWQADTFDPKAIDRELGWAQDLGMNTMRVFLHDLAWQQDPEGFKQRVGEFLDIAQSHGIMPMIVLFDSCWDPSPVVGKQREPIDGLHNSGWVQGPGMKALADTSEHPRLHDYVKDIVSSFGKDKRILAWDVWNEPDNTNDAGYKDAPHKLECVKKLLPQAFEWVREANPEQPLTSGVWLGDWSHDEKLKAIEKIQLENSDIISFHNYEKPEEFQARIEHLRRYDRPVLCTEYMARPQGSTFQDILPVAEKNDIGMFNWGFVQGKSQTHIPWDSQADTTPYTKDKEFQWFHDILHSDGRPYDSKETQFIREIISGHCQILPDSSERQRGWSVATPSADGWRGDIARETTEGRIPLRP